MRTAAAAWLSALIVALALGFVAGLLLPGPRRECYTVTIVNSYTDHGVNHQLPPDVSLACF